jgi:flagellar export protein FliJ
MTRKKNRLATVEALYASRETTAGRELVSAETTLLQSRQQYQLLIDERDRPCNPQTNLGVGGLQNRAEFLRRLEQAIRQQQLVVERAELELKAARQRFVHCRQRTMAVGKANAKRLATQRSRAEKREQKEQDAWRAPGRHTEAGEP